MRINSLVFSVVFLFLISCGGSSGKGSLQESTAEDENQGDIPVSADWANIPRYIDETTAAGNIHYNSGGRRIVRISGTTIALVNDGGVDLIYRSIDNGANWSEIDFENGFSSCLVSGPNNYVYHFSRYGSNIRMVKFRYDTDIIPAPINIYQNLSSSNHGAYTMINATIDDTGTLFVFFHHDTGTGGDSIYMLRSEDAGDTWSAPIPVRAGTTGDSWGFVHSDVTPEGDVIIVYSQWGSATSQFGMSTDNGNTWSHTTIASGSIYNPAVLPVGNNEVYIFAQSDPDDGLVFKKSTDSGTSWPNDWASIQANHASGYADPSPALGDDGTIYVAFRGAEAYTSLSDDLRSFIATSTDGGDSWIFPDNHIDGGRVGSRSTMRYQTWHNYGGPLEWTWLEEDGEDSNIYPTMYDINSDVTIRNLLN